ncbi:MAG: DNA recombination protein RmuC, partial [Paraperlucidibaca sp.]
SLALGSASGVVLASLLWWILGRGHRREWALQNSHAMQREQDLQARLSASEQAFKSYVSATELAHKDSHAQHIMLREQVAALTQTLTSERQASQEKLALLEEAKVSLRQQFELLAQQILEEKSKRFSEQNQQALGQMLEPLKTRLTEFQSRVDAVHSDDTKQRSALTENLRTLMNLNQELSQRANQLTNALTSQNKTQGNWGEMVLEQVLQSSGLIKGQQYEVQVSHTREDGTRAQPDVIINLPDNKHLIIDAKMSLNAYMDYANAKDDATRDAALRRHLDSIRAHIKGLSERNYQDIFPTSSPDFVLMFVPVEPAFLLATTSDERLWQEAWQRNILLVSPNTLLFVMRMVAHVWQQENQTRNAQEIANRGKELYEKFVGFSENLAKVGERITQAQSAYDTAFKQLKTGSGNLVRQAEMLRNLGITAPKKRLSQALLDESDLDDSSAGDSTTSEPTE